MTAFILYTDGKHDIDGLCIKNVELNKINIIIPHIGETFIDKVRNVEYEVKDVVRTYNAYNEYGVQVMLERREKRKYKCK
jgi:hypothetical protein